MQICVDQAKVQCVTRQEEGPCTVPSPRCHRWSPLGCSHCRSSPSLRRRSCMALVDPADTESLTNIPPQIQT